ncbi:MAG: HD domain-containing phosphohydrolase [Gammaproteobacteria bacterium]
MSETNAGTLDEELIQDFRDEFLDAYESMQQILIDLEKDPTHAEKLKEFFRVIHSVKSNLRMVELDDISDMVHGLENILDNIRHGELGFNTKMSDLFLLSMDKVRNAFEAAFVGDMAPGKSLKEIKQLLGSIMADNPELDKDMLKVLGALDPGYAEQKESVDPEEFVTDLHFFQQISEFVEDRFFYKKGCTQSSLAMALKMNEIAGSPVDPDQLSMGVFVHDFGMALLPVEILHKKEKFTEEDRRVVETHPELGTHILAHLEHWKDALEMVIQHHEREDGEGYPNKLKGDEICDGAKILAITDTFESMTNFRPDREHKRPIIRAVTEINGQAGSQFDAGWVEYFNQAIRKIYIQ